VQLPARDVRGKRDGLQYGKRGSGGRNARGGDVASLVRRSLRNIVLWSEVTFSEARHRAHEHSEQR
jgi:hypothetical protein